MTLPTISYTTTRYHAREITAHMEAQRIRHTKAEGQARVETVLRA